MCARREAESVSLRKTFAQPRIASRRASSKHTYIFNKYTNIYYLEKEFIHHIRGGRLDPIVEHFLLALRSATPIGTLVVWVGPQDQGKINAPKILLFRDADGNDGVVLAEGDLCLEKG